jgi:nucleoside-diphosphate-sugar epimerase
VQWREKRVLVTGGAGFLGSFVRLYNEVQPHIVISLPARGAVVSGTAVAAATDAVSGK